MNATHELPQTPAELGFLALPSVGTTIFTVMSALAAQGAVSLGQVSPISIAIRASSTRSRKPCATATTSTRRWPAPPLRQAIAAKIDTLYGRQYDADRKILVTASCASASGRDPLLRASSDEVIVIEPMYGNYVPSIELAGSKRYSAAAGSARLRRPLSKIAA